MCVQIEPNENEMKSEYLQVRLEQANKKAQIKKSRLVDQDNGVRCNNVKVVKSSEVVKGNPKVFFSKQWKKAVCLIHGFICQCKPTQIKAELWQFDVVCFNLFQIQCAEAQSLENKMCNSPST